MRKQHRNEKRPSRQAKGREQRSTCSVSQRKAMTEWAFMIGAATFCLLVMPKLMYMVIAPMKGWC